MLHVCNSDKSPVCCKPGGECILSPLNAFALLLLWVLCAVFQTILKPAKLVFLSPDRSWEYMPPRLSLPVRQVPRSLWEAEGRCPPCPQRCPVLVPWLGRGPCLHVDCDGPGGAAPGESYWQLPRGGHALALGPREAAQGQPGGRGEGTPGQEPLLRFLWEGWRGRASRLSLSGFRALGHGLCPLVSCLAWGDEGSRRCPGVSV